FRNEMIVDQNQEVQSPCIGVCVVDEVSQLCQGCFRTLGEIQDWSDLSFSQKQAIVNEASQREAGLFD
ncbi:MAG: DUF1289 domain-containing protein, partial [Methylophilaceae bacterium]|nr:DUF1289 domain-containing protein [Methylophilaceae bacterium]